MMEEDSWIYVDDSFSSNESFSDSDKIDSETEAELYSLIHFQGNLSNVSCQSSEIKNDPTSGASVFPDKMKYVLSTENSDYNGETEVVGNSRSFLQNGMNEFIGIENCDETVSDNSPVQVFRETEKIFQIDHEVPAFLVNNSNSNQLAQTRLSNHKNKRKFDHSPTNKAVEDVDPFENKDIHTNIYDDDEATIFISSDSETEYSEPPKMRLSSRQNTSMPNLRIEENSKDLWFVNQEDISRARNKKSRRYHDKVDITCSNCSRKGHHSRICPLPKSIKCFICGGEHIGTACVNRVCGKCYKTGHDSRSCRLPHVCVCELCHMQGHFRKNCPDLWRRYHLTTEPGQVVPDKKVNQNSSVFCYKCGRPGHFGAVCSFESRGYKNCFPTWPNVLSYDEPYSLPIQTSNTFVMNQSVSKKNSAAKRKKKTLTEAQIQSVAKNDSDTKRKKKTLTDAQKIARKERLKRKRLKRQELLNSRKFKLQKFKDNCSDSKMSKVQKEKNFPRTPKNKSAFNPSNPRSPNNSTVKLFSHKAQKSNFEINLSCPKTSDDSVVILPTPKVKKNISFVDLTSPSKNNSINYHTTPKLQKNSSAFDESIDLPESVRLMMLAQSRRREKRRKQKIRRRQKRSVGWREIEQNTAEI